MEIQANIFDVPNKVDNEIMEIAAKHFDLQTLCCIIKWSGNNYSWQQVSLLENLNKYNNLKWAHFCVLYSMTIGTHEIVF